MRIQKPKKESDWLYSEINKDRWFTKEACLPNGAPELPECTNEEKEQWEHEHKQPEPEENNENNE